MGAACFLSVKNPTARWLLLMVAVCFFRPQAFAAPQTVDAQQTISGGEFRIAGTAVSKTDGRALARARIILRDTKDPRRFQSVLTEEDGKFLFSGLPAGKYSVQGAKRGFISAGYDQHDQFFTAIVTGAGLETEMLMLRLAPDAVITGRIMDEVGEPVRHATVMLFYDDHSRGVDQVHQFRNAQTDDQGMFEITPLIPGTYFLSATATPWYAIHPNSETAGQQASSAVDRGLDVAYPVTYYPDVTEAESAAAIPIRGGERLTIDIHLNPVPALRLLFRVPKSGGGGFSFPQLQQSTFDSSTFIQTGGNRVISPGLLEITGIPAGRYNVRLFGQGGQSLQMEGVELGKDGEEVDVTKGEPLSSVNVSVQMQGGVTVPPRLIVGLRAGPKLFPVWQMVSPKGEIQFQQVSAGRYEIVAGASGKTFSIAHMSAEGASVSGHTLTVAAGSSPSVLLTLVAGNAEIQGIVNRVGKPFAGAMVVLVPKNPEMNRDLFRRDQSDLDGTFTLRGVVPGSYTVLALENGWEMDWSQPGVMAAYIKHGRTIRVDGQVTRPLNLEEAIEVQSK